MAQTSKIYPLKFEREFAGVNYLQDEELAKSIGLPKTYTGKGVLLAIMDGPFDSLHIAFIDPVTLQHRVKYSFTGTTPNRLYTTPAGKVVLPLSRQTHGSHVAGIAAGSYDGEQGLAGIATGADLMFCECSLPDIKAGLKRIKFIADSLNVPCVVNISQSFGKSLTLCLQKEPLQQMLNDFTDNGNAPGRIICVASSNSGKCAGTPCIKHTFTSDKDTLRILSKDIRTDGFGTTEGGMIAYFTDSTSSKVIVEAYNTSNCCKAKTFSFSDASKKDPLTTVESLTAQLHKKKDIYGNEFIVYGDGRYTNYISSDEDMALSFSLIGKKGSTVTIETTSVNKMVPSGYTTYNSTLPLGGVDLIACTPSVISVGNVSSKDISYHNYTYLRGQIDPKSAWGESLDGTKYPDVCAPGEMVLSALPDGVEAKPDYSITYAYLPKVTHQYNYAYNEGTSMAAPFMAGVAALLLEQDPTLTVNQLRQLLYKTNDWNKYCQNTAGCPGGHGILNAKKLMQALVAEQNGTQDQSVSKATGK